MAHLAGRATVRVVALAAAAAVATGLLAAAPATAVAGGASTTMARTWGVDGRVLAVLPVGDRVVVAGSFQNVVDTAGRPHPAGNVALFDPATGRFDTRWPVTADKTVNALAADGGTLYLGGAFRAVNGAPERGIAAVDLVSGERVASFAADAVDKEVAALAVERGHLYAGGSFTKVGDAAGSRAAAFVARFELGTGRHDTTWAPGPNDRVHTLLATGSGVYVGGDFTAVGGVFALTRLFRTDADGAVDPVFRAGPTNEGARAPVMALALAGSDLLVASGGSGGGCAALDAVTGSTRWSKHGNGNVVAAVVVGRFAYCGGHFNGSGGFDGLTRTKLAVVDLPTGETLPDAPLINSSLGVWSMAADAGGVYLGGDFTKVGATPQPRFGVLPLEGTQRLPGAPDELRAVPADGAVALSWVPPSHDGGSPVRTYRVWREEAGRAPVLVGSARQTNLVDTTAVNGVTYTYSVRARTDVGDGPAGAGVTTSPVAVVSAPGAPTGLTAEGTLGAARLTWTLPGFDGGSPLTAVRVYRSTGGGTPALLTELGPAATTYEDRAVEVGVRYVYQVAAVNAVGESSWSAPVPAVPSSGEPTAPTLTAVATAEGVVLAWEPTSEGASAITKYVVIRDGIRLATVPGTTRGITDATVLPGTSYGYQVKAQNAYGTSRLSALVVVTAV